MSKTRIAVAGAGSIGLAHMALAQRSASCTLCAVVDPSPAARAHAEQAGVPWHPSLAALFEADRPNGMIVAKPNALHVPHALECIEAGVAVLLEKPIVTTLDEGERLVQIAEQTGAKLLIGHHRAHSAIMAKAREVVAQGVLGKLVAVMGSATFSSPTTTLHRRPGGARSVPGRSC